MKDRTETFLRAFALAATGQLDEAERLLDADPVEAKSARELDLLARIAVQRGDDARARTLWERALATDPQDFTARAALKILQGHWRTWNGLRAICLVAVPVILLVTTLIGSITYLRCYNTVKRQNVKIRDMARVIAGIPPKLNPGDFQIPGCTTTQLQDGDIRIELPEPSPSAVQLRTIGSSISNRANTCLVVAETPRDRAQPGKRVPEGQSLRRANVLAVCLGELSGMPMNQFAVWTSPTTNSMALAIRIARRMPDLP
jgi:hypothetical protein